MGDCTALQCIAMHCNPVNRLCVIERLKWEESHANAADRDDRVESVRNRVYSIIYSSFISVQFVGVQVFLLRVNHACETNRSVTVHNNLDKPLEAAVVESSSLRVDEDGVRLVTVGREVEEPSAVVRASEERMVERGVAGSVRELLQRVVGGNHEPFGIGPDAVALQLGDEGVPIGPHLDLLFQLAEPLHTGIIEAGHRLATGWPQAVCGSRPTSGSRASCRREGRCLFVS